MLPLHVYDLVSLCGSKGSNVCCVILQSLIIGSLITVFTF